MDSEYTMWRSLAKSVVAPCIPRVHQGNSHHVFNFWACPGIDCSALLSAISRELAQDLPAQNVVHLDIQQLEPALINAITGRDVIGPNRDGGFPLQGFPLILLADGLDRLEGTQQFFAIERALKPWLANAPNGLILILTTNSPAIKWGASELWMITQNMQIGPLRREQLLHIVEHPESDPCSTWSITFGYIPAMVCCHSESQPSRLTLANRVFALAVKGCSPQTQELALLASLLPFFNVAVLRMIMDVIDDDDSRGGYSLAINELQDLGIITWDSELGWFRFTDGALRRLLATKFAAENPRTAAMLCDRALQYFAAEAKRGAFLHFSFVSMIYHLAANSLVGGNAATALCLDWFQRSLSTWHNVAWDAVLEAWQTGGGDWHVQDELESRLGHENCTLISRAIVAARSQSNE